MSQRMTLTLVLAVVALALAWTPLRGQVRQPDVWQYKIVSSSTTEFKGEATLNELGLAGWELVAVSSNGSDLAGAQYVVKRRAGKP